MNTKRFFAIVTLCLATLMRSLSASAQLAVDERGWTILEPADDALVFYVSNSGSDANDGLTAEKPKKTIKNTVALIAKRRGHPDWIKLDRGSVFEEGRISLSITGRSATEPLVWTSYGVGARPVIKNSELFYYWQNDPPTFRMDFVTFSGIDFVGSGANRGMLLSGPKSQILIEDCRFIGLSLGVYLQLQDSHQKAPNFTPPWVTNIRIRRNSFIDCTDLAGIHAAKTDGLTIENNLFDRCGQPNPTILKHNVYLKEARNLTVSGNYFLRGSNMGLKCSSDNIEGFKNFRIDRNYFYNNALSLDHSKGIDWDVLAAHSHVNGIISHNVFHESARTFGTRQQDLAIWTLNARDITYQGNHFVHKTLWNGNNMIAWGEKQDRITVRDNLVYDWAMPPSKPDRGFFQANWAENVTNGLQENNTIAKTGSQFADPNRTLLTWLNETDVDAASLRLRDLHTRDGWDAGRTADKAVEHVIDGFRVVNPIPVSDTEPEPEPDIEPEPERVVAVRESDVVELIDAVAGVLSVLKQIAGRN